MARSDTLPIHGLQVGSDRDKGHDMTRHNKHVTRVRDKDSIRLLL